MTEVQLFALCALTLGFLTVDLLCSLRRLSARRWKKLAEQRSRERDDALDVRAKSEERAKGWHESWLRLHWDFCKQRYQLRALQVALDSAQKRAAVKVDAAGYASSARSLEKLASHPMGWLRDAVADDTREGARIAKAAAHSLENEATPASGLVLAKMLSADGAYELRSPFLPPATALKLTYIDDGPAARVTYSPPSKGGLREIEVKDENP